MRATVAPASAAVPPNGSTYRVKLNRQEGGHGVGAVGQRQAARAGGPHHTVADPGARGAAAVAGSKLT